MITHTMHALHGADLGGIMLVTGYERDKVLAQVPSNILFAEVYNPNYRVGMTSSIQQAIAACPNEVQGYLICLADQIHIQSATYTDIVQYFLNNNSTHEGLIVSPYYDHKKGNPVLISSDYKEQILQLEECNGCRPILQANASRVLAFHTADRGILMDIDTPKDIPQQ